MNRLYYIPNKQFLEELLIHLHETGYKWKGQFPLTSYIMFYLIWPSRNGDLGIYIDEHSKLVSHCNFSKIAKQKNGKIRVIQNKALNKSNAWISLMFMKELISCISGLVSLIKQRNEYMENDIIDLLGLMEELIEEKYYYDTEYFFLYGKFSKALEAVKEKLDLVDELQDKIDELEADNERLEEERDKLEGQMYDWQEDYQRLEREYAKLTENS